MKYKVAERFKSIQGEGVYAGTPMAFIRFVGCSVGKAICNACDTDFAKIMSWRQGGEFTARELVDWVEPHRHVCLTGGEPLDQELEALIAELTAEYPDPSADPSARVMVHVETSGTRPIPALPAGMSWVCVSPKPGYREDVVAQADEVKVIVPGLGDGEGWPTLEDALRWARAGKVVFLQPRNLRMEINNENMRYVLDLVRDHPELRLSVQLHKILRVQ